MTLQTAGTKGDSGLIVLGSAQQPTAARCPLEVHVGRIKPCKRPPRVEEPTKLGSWTKGMTWHARRSTNAAAVLLQRVVCPFLDYDLRARADKHVATQQKRVHDAVFQAWPQSLDESSGPEQQSQIAAPG